MAFGMKKGTSITIIINPPWWRTWWAYSIYGLLLLRPHVLIHAIRMQKQRIIEGKTKKHN